mmetsp:Transcript_73375/g.116157  ORF Transcript_73375/g.116157 Transcript_73375/m.116157 type:complete len:664 (+) Transcript_73375:33-2024(+)
MLVPAICYFAIFSSANSHSQRTSRDKRTLRSLLLAVQTSGNGKIRGFRSPSMVAPSTLEFRKQHSLTVENEGSKEYEPMPTFDQTPFNDKIKSVWASLGYESPSAIQAQSFPIALDGRDIISIARTGSGKTIGFLMPAFHIFMNKAEEVKELASAKIENPSKWQIFYSNSPFWRWLASESGAESIYAGNELTIQASPEKLDEVVEKVKELLEDEPATTEALLQDDKIGLLIGAGGSNLRAIGDQTGAEVNIPRSAVGLVEIEITGPASQIHEAKKLVEGVRRPRLNARNSASPRGLVLAPTRELVQQIQEEAKKYEAATGIKTVALYGGEKKNLQMQALKVMPDIVVATPGRCNDLADMGAIDLSKVQYLVLDEADRMLDMGFQPQIKDILRFVPDKKQTLFFSATWPKEVQWLASKYLVDPVHVTIGNSDELNANKNIEQKFIFGSNWQKETQFMELLQELNPSADKNPLKLPKMLIFKNTKVAADDLADKLYNAGYECEAIHGDVPQEARTRIMQDYKAGRLNVLVATDVAARGLDVKDILYVINLDLPNNIEDYVHRIGRTARGDAKGISYAFFTPDENKGTAKGLVEVLQRAKQPVPEELMEHVDEPQNRNSRYSSSDGSSYGGSSSSSGRSYKPSGGGRSSSAGSSGSNDFEFDFDWR